MRTLKKLWGNDTVRTIAMALCFSIPLVAILYTIPELFNYTEIEVLVTTSEAENSEVARITNIEFIEQTTRRVPIKVGKFTSMRTQTKPAQYLVTIVYDGITKTFDNETLYNAAKAGEDVTATFIFKYGKWSDDLYSVDLKVED